MNNTKKKPAEKLNERTVETLIREALSLGMRVVHHPYRKANAMSLRKFAELRRMQMRQSAEA